MLIGQSDTEALRDNVYLVSFKMNKNRVFLILIKLRAKAFVIIFSIVSFQNLTFYKLLQIYSNNIDKVLTLTRVMYELNLENKSNHKLFVKNNE